MASVAFGTVSQPIDLFLERIYPLHQFVIMRHQCAVAVLFPLKLPLKVLYRQHTIQVRSCPCNATTLQTMWRGPPRCG
jgi:hypothetical protein